jgi:hypothetical protein
MTRIFSGGMHLETVRPKSSLMSDSNQLQTDYFELLVEQRRAQREKGTGDRR